MLVESLVKSTLELQGFRVARVVGDTSGLVAMLEADLRFSPRCGRCLAPARYRDTRPMRRFRHVPLWGIPVELRYEPRRVSCARCEGIHVESMPWVSGKRRMTRALMVTLATWTRVLPWKQVARLFRCAWGTVATAVECRRRLRTGPFRRRELVQRDGCGSSCGGRDGAMPLIWRSAWRDRRGL